MLFLCIIIHGVVAWASQQNTADQDATLQQWENGTQHPAGKAKPLPQPAWPATVPAIPSVAPNVALALQQQWALLQQMMNPLNQHPPPPLQLPRPRPAIHGQDCPDSADPSSRCKTPAAASSSIWKSWHRSSGRQSRCSAKWDWLSRSFTVSQCQCTRWGGLSQSSSYRSSCCRDPRPRQSLQSVACQSSSTTFRCGCFTSSQRQRGITAADSGPVARPHQPKPRKIQQRRPMGRMVLWRVRKSNWMGIQKCRSCRQFCPRAFKLEATYASAAMACLDNLGGSPQHQRGRSSRRRSRQCTSSGVRRCQRHCRSPTAGRGCRSGDSRATNRPCRRTVGPLGPAAFARASGHRRRCPRSASSFQHSSTASYAETQIPATKAFASPTCQHQKQATTLLCLAPAVTNGPCPELVGHTTTL